MEYLIWSIEHDAWWRPGWMGYTINLAEAGRYSELEAREILQRANLITVNECKIPATYVDAQPSIACPKCGTVSFNPNDIAERYCGRCHAFHADFQ